MFGACMMMVSAAMAKRAQPGGDKCSIIFSSSFDRGDKQVFYVLRFTVLDDKNQFEWGSCVFLLELSNHLHFRSSPNGAQGRLVQGGLDRSYVGFLTVALDVIGDILEATIAVIVSSLPTYKALPGIAKRKKTSLYQNTGHSGDAPRYKSRSNNTSALKGVELDICSTQVAKETRTNFSSYHSTEGSIDATNIM